VEAEVALALSPNLHSADTAFGKALEITAEFPIGATDIFKLGVSENARTLGLKSADWG
jgi:hypothetical protein